MAPNTIATPAVVATAAIAALVALITCARHSRTYSACASSQHIAVRYGWMAAASITAALATHVPPMGSDLKPGLSVPPTGSDLKNSHFQPRKRVGRDPSSDLTP